MVRATLLGLLQFARSLTASEGAERMMIGAGTLGGVLVVAALLQPLLLGLAAIFVTGLGLVWLLASGRGFSGQTPPVRAAGHRRRSETPVDGTQPRSRRPSGPR
jgi:hypothetical protein